MIGRAPQLAITSVSVALNLGLVIAILSVKMGGRGSASEGEPKVARQGAKLTALSHFAWQADTGINAADPVGSGRFIMVDGVQIPLGTVRLPWLMAEAALGHKRGPSLGSEGEISNRLAHSLALTVSEKTRLDEVVRRAGGEAKAIEKSSTSLMRDGEGSSYYVITPNPVAKAELRKRMRGEVAEILGAERAWEMIVAVEDHSYFAPHEDVLELAVEDGSGVIEYEFVISRTDPSGTQSEQRHIMDKFGVGTIERRWGHLFETRPWKEFLEANDPGPDKELYVPRSLRKTGNVLLDGFPEGESIFR